MGSTPRQAPFVALSIRGYGTFLCLASLSLLSCGSKPMQDSDLYTDWRKHDEADRLPFAREIVKRGILVGKSRVEIQQLLGNPIRPRGVSEGDVVYYLGEDTFAFGSLWLAIDFSDTDRVDAARVVVD